MRIALIAAGSLSVAVGAVGAVLPILPTTPFLLIGAFCFYRSSRRLHHWLTHHRRFGPMIRQVRSGQGLTLRVKLGSLAAAYIMVGTVIITVDNLHLRIFLALLLLAKTIFMIRIPTYQAGRKDKLVHN